MAFLTRYQDRRSSLKVDHELVENGRKGNVHSLNDFDIFVWEDGTVEARRKNYVTSDPGKHFPNMQVADGAITLPIEDLVSFILERISMTELAEGIMADSDAREELVHKMAERYSSPTFEDKDRRKFLEEVQCSIYSVALDNVVTRLNNAETNKRSRDDYYRWKAVELGHYSNLYESYIAALYELREAGKIDDAGFENRKSWHTHPGRLAEIIKEGRDPAATESVGPQWHESRDFWRAELMKFFPEPKQGDEDDQSDEPDLA